MLCQLYANRPYILHNNASTAFSPIAFREGDFVSACTYARRGVAANLSVFMRRPLSSAGLRIMSFFSLKVSKFIHAISATAE
jgi:hypothetical protein